MTLPSAILATSVAPEPRAPIRLARHVPRAGAPRRFRLGWLEDAGLLLLIAFAFPLVIVVAGAPLGFLVRLLLEIVRRW